MLKDNIKIIDAVHYLNRMEEDFTSPLKRKEHYNKHVLGQPDSKGDVDENPLGKDYFTSDKFYEYHANQLAKKRVDGKNIIGFARYKLHGGVAYYKYDTYSHEFVIYSLGYHDDGSDLANENPRIITMYKMSPEEYKALYDSYKRLEKRGKGKLMEINKKTNDFARKSTQDWLKSKK